MSGRRGYWGPMPRMRLAVLPLAWAARYSSKTMCFLPVTIACSAFTTTISSPFSRRFARTEAIRPTTCPVASMIGIVTP